MLKFDNIVTVEEAKKYQEKSEKIDLKENEAEIQKYVDFLSQKIREQFKKKGRVYLLIPKSRGSNLAVEFAIQQGVVGWNNKFAHLAMQQIISQYEKSGFYTSYYTSTFHYYISTKG